MGSWLDRHGVIDLVVGLVVVETDVVEESILDDPELNARYWDEIPVVIIEDRVHTIWRVDPARLRAALTGRR